MSLKKTTELATLQEMIARLKEINSSTDKQSGRIPFSDTCFKKDFADICTSNDKMLYYLRILTDAHYVFTIHIVEDDSNKMMAGVNGYVISEPLIVDALLDSTSRSLEAAYEQKFYKRSSISTIIRELLPQAKIYNNTPLGRVLNITVMLQQFQKLLRIDFEQYTEVWKRNQLNHLLKEMGHDSEESQAHDDADLLDTHTDTEAEVEVEDEAVPDSHHFSDDDEMDDSDEPHSSEEKKAAPQRAVDNPDLEKIQEMDKSGQWGKAVDKYGTQFLIRIHLRKYEFDKIRWLINTKKIAKEVDLRFIRDSIRKMEGRFEMDPQLNRYKKEMAEVKRSCQLRINEIFQHQKNS